MTERGKKEPETLQVCGTCKGDSAKPVVETLKYKVCRQCGGQAKHKMHCGGHDVACQGCGLHGVVNCETSGEAWSHWIKFNASALADSG